MSVVTIGQEQGTFAFQLDPRIERPADYRVAFLIMLDGDLVMTPEHLGVAYMTAVLRRAGFTVGIFEVENELPDEGLAELEKFAPALACFTLMSINLTSFVSFVDGLKKKLPALRVACGGPAVSYATDTVWASSAHVEILALGEGERTIFELVQRLCAGDDLDGCPGIWYRTEAGIKRNGLPPLIHNLDDLPFPARDQLELHGNRLEYVRLSTSRGCVARCSFCSAPHARNRIQHGKAWRSRSVDSVLAEVEHIVHRYGFRTLDFIDSTFEDPDGGRIGKGRIRQLAQGLLDRKLDIFYNCCMRAENWGEDDHELLELLVRSGLEKVNVGIESGVEEELRLWDKLATVEDNVRIIRLLREHGLYLAMGFIQFHPYSTVDTLKQNARFLRDHAGHNLRRLTERLEVYPGTPIAKKLEGEGLMDEGYLTSLDPYAYGFRDERVGRLAVHFASLYNNDDYHQRGVITDQSSVFRFETFNVVVQTFISRITRRWAASPEVLEILAAFKQRLHEIRQEMGKFNYDFFMSNLEDVLSGQESEQRRRSQVSDVEAYFASRMEEIYREQLKAGRQMSRAGADLREIRSSVALSVPGGGAPRTYTGSAPCW